MTERTRKRADDTGLLMYEMITNGLESEQGRAAVRRPQSDPPSVRHSG